MESVFVGDCVCKYVEKMWCIVFCGWLCVFVNMWRKCDVDCLYERWCVRLCVNMWRKCNVDCLCGCLSVCFVNMWTKCDGYVGVSGCVCFCLVNMQRKVYILPIVCCVYNTVIDTCLVVVRLTMWYCVYLIKTLQAFTWVLNPNWCMNFDKVVYKFW
jgi:hypothetical protein